MDVHPPNHSENRSSPSSHRANRSCMISQAGDPGGWLPHGFMAIHCQRTVVCRVPKELEERILGMIHPASHHRWCQPGLHLAAHPGRYLAVHTKIVGCGGCSPLPMVFRYRTILTLPIISWISVQQVDFPYVFPANYFLRVIPNH